MKAGMENDTASSHTYVDEDDDVLELFAPLIEKKNIQCGLFSSEEVELLFMEDASEVASAAIIPVYNSGIYGLIALGSRDEQRYHQGMGTDFLSSLANLIGAAMRAHLR